ncbi:MAG: addiction module protein [Nitrospirae bacterium]|nr:addiction module protein [Nitrospirota bacterium]
MKVEEIESEALGLDMDARARLAEKLILSLECASDEEIESLWVAEALRRDAEMDAGMPGRSMEDVFRDARKRLE